MKITKLFFPLLLLLTLASSCGFGGKNNSKNAVCVWNKVSLRVEPSEKSKWLAAINLGEKVTFLDEKATDASGKKPIEFVKVALQDGKEGWVRADYIVLNSEPAVFIYNATIYNRPDLLTKSDKNFNAMDIVAVKTGEDTSWLEVIGKRADGQWIETGWVKPENLSYLDTDIAVAIFTQAAIAEKDDDKRLSMLQEISANSDLSNSFFMSSVYDMISYLSGDGEYSDEGEYESGEEGEAETEVEAVSEDSTVYVVE